MLTLHILNLWVHLQCGAKTVHLDWLAYSRVLSAARMLFGSSLGINLPFFIHMCVPAFRWGCLSWRLTAIVGIMSPRGFPCWGLANVWQWTRTITCYRTKVLCCRTRSPRGETENIKFWYFSNGILCTWTAGEVQVERKMCDTFTVNRSRIQNRHQILHADVIINSMDVTETLTLQIPKAESKSNHKSQC